jgi:cytochrome c oxidase subunit 3
MSDAGARQSHMPPQADSRHSPHLAHHFETPRQQFEAGKLGMWMFLSTEVLLFSGLFCAYAVYRANHPEIFEWAHKYLNVWLGGTNTIVLISSSLTMAWAVRAAQLGRQRILVTCLSLTLLGGLTFLGIKYVEYKNKWEEGLLWVGQYKPTPEAVEQLHSEMRLPVVPATTGPAAPGESTAAGGGVAAGTATTSPPASLPAQIIDGLKIERSLIAPAATGPQGLRQPARAGLLHLLPPQAPRNLGIFFSIYFLMTGLHGLHVIAGLVVISWLLTRALKGRFGPNYYTPVDLVGLYWHLVDIIWIFLFPLLYLIH